MRNASFRSISILAISILATAGPALAASNAPAATGCGLVTETVAPFTPVATCDNVADELLALAGNCTAAQEPLALDGKGKPPREACCDPALEPGANGNPLCFEGHTCCFDGVWRCNNPDGSPSCKAGEVCPAGCGSRGDACTVAGDCCSQVCGKNGRCK
jgi:hypothetical protein